MNRKDRSKPVSNGPKATISEKLDEALKESFPASDPVSLGHSEHIGQPKLSERRETGHRGAQKNERNMGPGPFAMTWDLTAQRYQSSDRNPTQRGV